MKNPNGFGGISKLSGKRRRPYMARATAGFDSKGKQKYTVVGYFETRKEALLALSDYNRAPTTKINMTLGQLYEEWCETKAFTSLSKSTQDTYTASWNKRMSALQSEKMKDLRTGKIQAIIDESESAGKSLSSMQKDKNLMSLLYEYAMQNDIVHKNYARFVELPADDGTTTKDAFSEVELTKIEKAAGVVPFADCIMMLCYTGFRIQEFLTLTPFSYDKEAQTLTGGMKTDAGKDRVIPVHPKIKKYVEEWISKKGETIICKNDGTPYSVNYFRKSCYHKALSQIEGVRELNPHCCRHTFATLLHNSNVDPLDVEFLMGHASYKMSKKYTHAQIDRLKSAVNSL